jgi:hypothetical protein
MSLALSKLDKQLTQQNPERISPLDITKQFPGTSKTWLYIQDI